MAVTAEQLRKIHRIHRQQSDLKDRIERGPRQVRMGEQTVVRFETELSDAQAAKKRARIDCDEKQGLLQQRETSIEDSKRKRNECKTNTEFKLLNERIAADQQANSVLEDEILEKLELIDELTEKVKGAEEKLANSKQELDKTKTRVEGEQDELKAELERVINELAEAEKALPGDIKQDYDRVVRARGEEALAQVDDESCGHCYTILPPQTINLLMMDNAVLCKSCGSLLYLPEDRQPT